MPPSIDISNRFANDYLNFIDIKVTFSSMQKYSCVLIELSVSLKKIKTFG